MRPALFVSPAPPPSRAYVAVIDSNLGTVLGTIGSVMRAASLYAVHDACPPAGS